MKLTDKEIKKLVLMTGIEEGKTCLDTSGCISLIKDTEKMILKKLSLK